MALIINQVLSLPQLLHVASVQVCVVCPVSVQYLSGIYILCVFYIIGDIHEHTVYALYFSFGLDEALNWYCSIV